MGIKEKIRPRLSKVIFWLQQLEAELTKPVLRDLPYTSLSANDKAENVEEYLDALDWAIENRKKYGIFNVALTGPYGSGKSSILKTYIASRRGKGNFFLPISLATFHEEKLAEDGTQPGKNDMLRLIELSILQQIFYHEDDRKIPDSRFRKIKSFSAFQLILITGCMLSFAIATFLLFFPSIISDGLLLGKNYAVPKILHWFCIGTFVLGLLFIIYCKIRFH